MCDSINTFTMIFKNGGSAELHYSNSCAKKKKGKSAVVFHTGQAKVPFTQNIKKVSQRKETESSRVLYSAIFQNFRFLILKLIFLKIEMNLAVVSSSNQ